jgi:hypothetical protein
MNEQSPPAGHTSRHGHTVTIDLPDLAAAEEVAEALAHRGHSLIALRPQRTPGRRGTSEGIGTGEGWTVVALDEGPYPSQDEAWWHAAERREVRALARAHGGTLAGATTSLVESARGLFDRGALRYDRTADEVRAARLKALYEVVPRAAVPQPEHRLAVVHEPGGTGFPLTLPGLDRVNWAALRHAYGPAQDVPRMLQALADNDDTWDETMGELIGSVLHQGTCSTSTPVTVRFLARFARSPQLRAARRTELLAHLFYAATIDPAPVTEGREPTDASRTHRAVVAELPALLAGWSRATDGERAWLVLLATLDPAAGAPLFPVLRAFRARIGGASPVLDLALALAEPDPGAALGLAEEIATWQDGVPELLDTDEPLTIRLLNVLCLLSEGELLG